MKRRTNSIKSQTIAIVCAITLAVPVPALAAGSEALTAAQETVVLHTSAESDSSQNAASQAQSTTAQTDTQQSTAAQTDTQQSTAAQTTVTPHNEVIGNKVYAIKADGSKSVLKKTKPYTIKISGKLYVVKANGKLWPAKKWAKIGKKKYYISKKAGIPVTGIKKIKKHYYYFQTTGKKAGVLATANVKENKVIYYINPNSELVGYKKGGQYYTASKKKMKGRRKAEFETYLRAQKVVNKITTNKMSKSKKLKVCFEYTKKHYGECKPRMPDYYGVDWPTVYANDMFIRGRGSCYSYAAAFAFMAKAIGYDDVYCCNSGGHGWAEIDGKVYDPEWDKHDHSYSYYAVSYYARTNVRYRAAISTGKKWMHVYLH